MAQLKTHFPSHRLWYILLESQTSLFAYLVNKSYYIQNLVIIKIKISTVGKKKRLLRKTF